jgi:hypothetical protein
MGLRGRNWDIFSLDKSLLVDESSVITSPPTEPTTSTAIAGGIILNN